MVDGSMPDSTEDRPFPVARPVPLDLSLSRSERRRAGLGWSPFVWVAVALGLAFLGFTLVLFFVGPR